MMSTSKVATLALIFALPITVAQAEDACMTLAANLKQDVLEQGTSYDQYSQFYNLVASDDYAAWADASSSSHTFNGIFSIPEEVDIAIGDGQSSNQSSWNERRHKFLGMSYSKTSSSFRSSTHTAQTSVAAIQAIANCAKTIANREGVFLELVHVTPNQDAFTVKLWRSTSGGGDWKLKNFSVQPPQDSNFSCDNNAETATDAHQIDIVEQSILIGCHKNPNKHLLLTVQTTAGPAGSFELDNIDEKFKKLEKQIADLEVRLSGEIQTTSNTLNGSIQAVNGRVGSLEGERLTTGSVTLSDADLGSFIFHCPPGWALWGATYIAALPGSPAANWPPAIANSGSSWPARHVGICRKN